MPTLYLPYTTVFLLVQEICLLHFAILQNITADYLILFLHALTASVNGCGIALKIFSISASRPRRPVFRHPLCDGTAVLVYRLRGVGGGEKVPGKG